MKLKHHAPVKNQPGRPKDTIKREAIVRAATTLFMKNGYELTSMDAVAKKADVSKLTIYSHFTDKVDLFKEVVRVRCNKLATPESFITLAKMPVEQALFQIGFEVASVVFSPDSVHLQRILQAEAVRHPEVVKTFYDAGPKRIREAFTELLKDFHRQGQISIADPKRATEQFFSLLKGEKILKTLMLLDPPPSPNEIQKHTKATVEFFLAAYRPHPKNTVGRP